MKATNQVTEIRRSRIKPGMMSGWVAYFEADFYRECPCVTLKDSEGNTQVIDIIATIKNDAASIGHPAILHAIKHWEAVVRFFYHLAIRGKRDDWSNWFGIYKLAEKNLERVGGALLEGAKERAISKEAALNGVVKSTNLGWEADDLRTTYEILTTDEVKARRRPEEKLRRVAQRLDEEARKSFYKNIDLENEMRERNNMLPVDAVRTEQLKNTCKRYMVKKLNFLEDDLRRSQANYEACLLNKPGTWDGFRKAYLSWEFAISKNTFQSYLSRIKNTPELSACDFPSDSLCFHIPKGDYPPVILANSPFAFV